MPPENVLIVAIVFGTGLSIVVLGMLTSIIKTWMKRGSSKSLPENKEFIAALREFKERTDRRLSNLEAIVTEEKRGKAKIEENPSQNKKHNSSIEIELDDFSDEEENSSKKGNLKNMLNQ